MASTDTARKSYGDRVRSARRRCGLTQQALADTVGATRLMVLTWEKGRHKPSERYQRLLSEALEAPDLAEDGEPSSVSLIDVLHDLVRQVVREELRR